RSRAADGGAGARRDRVSRGADRDRRPRRARAARFAPHRPTRRGVARGGRGMTAPALAPRPSHAEPPAARLVWRVADHRGPLGALVIDDVVAHGACGGLRIAAVVTDEELRDLAAVMTLKFAFFGIACGGAKAGLVVSEDASAEERRRRARAFGAAL